MKPWYILTFVFGVLFLSGFSQDKLKTGMWTGILKLNDTTDLPFSFEIKNTAGNITFDLINGAERISINEIRFDKDSVFIRMPVFDSEFRCEVKNDSMNGFWINHARKDKNKIPFMAFSAPKTESVLTLMYPSIGGKWEVDFSSDTKAVGVFNDGSSPYEVSGTFFTETGDYRYLAGCKTDKRFYLSCFDGSHAFLFTGEIKDDDITNGHFYSGAHHHEPWMAKRNDKFQLRNPDSLTYLKPGYTKIDFNFKNLSGKNVSLSDEKFKNKVVVIQLMGTWCPNCMDETKFLASFYEKYKTKGLEVVALAFERTDDFAKAVNNIQRTKTRFNAGYEFLITEKTGAQQASEALPMLNKVMAFPTTIYIDKKGNVRKIYTGFYGPATGVEYDKFVEETTKFTERLLAE